MAAIYNNLLYDADEKPSWKLSLALAIQHIALIYSGIVIMPVLIGRAVGLSTETIAFLVFITVVTSALATLIQIYKIGRVGSGMVLFMGSSGAYWSVSQAALGCRNNVLRLLWHVLAPCFRVKILSIRLNLMHSAPEKKHNNESPM